MPIKFEILMSTMFRENLDFLNPIFANNNIDDFHIIIVNQTSKDKLLQSNNPKIKVINSFEKGSPASRNLAIRNASADVCLMADDDIVYKPNLKATIQKAYEEYPHADMISFEAVDAKDNLYNAYGPAGKHDKKTLFKINTIIISFRRMAFKKNRIFFNHYFGVGSVFEGCTEYVFLMYAYSKNLNMLHVNKTIVSHPRISSGMLMGSDNAFFAKTALRQRLLGNLSYIWLLKYTFYMWKNGYIEFNEIPGKFKLGLNGIEKYKALEKAGEIDKVYES